MKPNSPSVSGSVAAPAYMGPFHTIFHNFKLHSSIIFFLL